MEMKREKGRRRRRTGIITKSRRKRGRLNEEKGKKEN